MLLTFYGVFADQGQLFVPLYQVRESLKFVQLAHATGFMSKSRAKCENVRALCWGQIEIILRLVLNFVSSSARGFHYPYRLYVGPSTDFLRLFHVL